MPLFDVWALDIVVISLIVFNSEQLNWSQVYYFEQYLKMPEPAIKVSLKKK